MMKLQCQLRFMLMLCVLGWMPSALAQTPSLGGGPGGGTVLGEGPFTFPLNLTNSGPPGFGPYVQLVLPPNVSFTSATSLGLGVVSTTIGPFPPAPGNQLIDPISGNMVTGPPGGTLIILEYPVGSVVTGAPPLGMSVTVNVDPMATINDPLSISATPVYQFGDTPTGVNGAISGAALMGTITPTLYEISKSNSAPEGERPPGPTWPIAYTITVDIANGETVTNLLISDVLPGDFQFTTGPNIVGGAGCNATNIPSTVTPGGTLEISCASVTGTASASDIVISYSGYFIDTLDETNCTDELKENTVTLDGEFPAGVPFAQGSAMSQVLVDHFTIQKGVSPGMGSPGQTVTFTLNLQLTDFGASSGALITDLLPDGYTFDAHQSMSFGGLPTAIVPTVIAAGDGTSTITYDVTAVTGNIVPGTAITIVYTATVDQDFTPGPDPILANDALTNNVALDYSLVAGATSCSNGSSATFNIVPIQFSKTVINPQASYDPGDIVTYRLTLTVPSGNTENITLEDYFPLPIHDVTSLNLTFGTDIRLAPTDTTGFTPTSITINPAENSLRTEWSPIVSNVLEVLAVDIDIQVEDTPFADGLLQSNISQASTSNTPGTSSTTVAPTQVLVRAPNLVITKGISASDNPTAAATISPSPGVLPVDGNISESDAGDTVTFVITVENTGGAPAFDVVITDPLVAGLTPVAVTSVADGDGNPLVSAGILGTGLTIVPGLAASDGMSGGADMAVITFTATIDTTVIPRETLTNTASTTWASRPGATSFPSISDDATVTMAGPVIAKSVDSIAPGGAGFGLVTSGDTVTYLYEITLPEGTTNGLTLVDDLPPGFSFVNVMVDTTGFAGTVDTSPTSGTTGTVDAGQTLTIDFDTPNATGVIGDNNPANNTFSVSVTALVSGTSTSNDGLPAVQAKTNRVTLDYIGRTGPTISDAASVNFAEPDLNITKTMSPNSGLDAGDTVTVTLRIENTGTSPAYDLTVTDTLNDDGNLFDLTSVLQGSTPAGYAFAYANPTVTYSADPATALSAGAIVEFTFTAMVRSDVISGSSYGNTASATADSQDGTVTGERSTSDNDSTSVLVQAVQAGKSIIDTSESWTSMGPISNVAIGEVITYQLVFDVPEGTTAEDGVNAIITDALPAGFAYQTGTAMIRGIFDTGISGSNFGAIPGVDTAVAPLVSGQTLEFDLGSLTVTDDDANGEQIILTYDVLVLNTSNNNRQNTKTNNGSLNYQNRNGMSQSITDSVSAVINEPRLTLNKMAAPASITGGGTVTFTVVVGNAFGIGSTRAWEPVVTDILPVRYNTPALVSATLSRGATDVSAGASFVGNALTADLSSLAPTEQYLAPNETITLIYTAVVDQSVAFEEMIINTATVTGTSLPGSNGTGALTPGAPGTSTGERTGTNLPNELMQNVNDLTISNSATVTADRPVITKTGDTNLQIGETTMMTVAISVPTGTTDNFVLTDNLPTGLSYTGTPISITVPGMNFTTTNSPSTTPGAGTDPLVFDFGSVTNSAAGAQSILITYEVQVQNILANQNSSALTNTASLSYLGSTMPLPSDTATVTVVEPNLNIGKNITAGAAGSDAGSMVSYQVTLSNTSMNGTAYAVDLQDVLPPELLGAPDGTGSTSPFFLNIMLTNPGDAVVLHSDGTTPLAVGDASIITSTNTGDSLTWPAFNIPPNTTLTITYDVIVANTANAGQMLTNNVSASYQSTEIVNAQTRDDSDSQDDDDGNLDNYGETGSTTLTIDSNIAISKSLTTGQPDNSFTMGETISFDLRVDVIEGIKGNVTVTDVLPSGLTYVGPVTIVATPNISYSGTGVAVEAPAGTLTIPMGDVTNPADGNNANDFFIIRFDALLDDVVGNANGGMLTNTASLTSDVGPAGPDTQVIQIVEPDLTIAKTPSNTNPSLGDEVIFTITVSHSMASTSDAFEVVLTDVIPTGLTYVAGSTMGQASVNETDPSAPIFDLGSITLADMQKTFSFRVTVNDTAPVGTPITNVIDGVYSSLAGSDPNERDYAVQGSGVVTPAVTALIEADKTVAITTDAGNPGIADPGDTLTYTVVLTNSNTTVTNVVFTDLLPATTTYVATSLTSSVGGEDDSADPALVVNVGTMAPMDVVTITFSVTINGGTPPGTVISNQGTVDSDQTVPEPTDSDGTDENGDQPTDITVGGPPPLGQPLYVEKLVSWLTDVDGSGDITEGDVMRYTLIFHNDGDQDLTGVTLTDVIPTGLTYVPASAMINSVGDTMNVVGANVSVAIALLGVKQSITGTFDVTIDPILPSSMTYVNQGTANSNQTDPVLTDSNGYPDDGSQPTVFVAVTDQPSAPVLDFEKRWDLAVDIDGDGLVDPGDTLEYRLILLNTGSAPATNVRIMDAIPPDTTLILGSVTSSLGIVISEDPIDVNMGPLNPGNTALVIFRVTVDGGTPNGTIIPNQATATSDNHPDTMSDDNGDDSDGINPTLTPVSTDGTAGTPGSLSKALQATSEAGSSGTQVFIGEQVTYQVSFSVPAGTLGEITVSDVLPTGLSYVTGSAQLSRMFDTGLSSSTNPGGVNSAATGVFVNLADGTELEINGNQISVYLGSIINSDNDANNETYVLRYVCQVDNIAGNQLGSVLNNQAGLSYANQLGQIQNLTPVMSSVTIEEAVLQVSKTVTPALLLTAGGDVTFTITVTNPSGANVGIGYDVSIVDMLPAQYTGLSIDNIVPAGGVSGISDNTVGTTLDVDVNVFPPDGTLTITATATAPGLLTPGTITNTATVQWTSLPGTNGMGSVTTGNPGDSDGERTGNGGDNDLVTTDTADVLIGDAAVTKSIVNPQTRYAIGDTVEYQVVLDLPPGAVFNDVMFLDILDEGLTYRSGTFMYFLTPDVSESGNPLDFNVVQNSPNPGEESLMLAFDTVMNTGTVTRQLRMTYEAVVDNILANQNNEMLSNDANFSFTDPGGSGNTITVDDTATATIGEPNLAITKTTTTPIVDLDAGDMITFLISVANNGTTTAFETVVSDVLPAGLENVTGLMMLTVLGGTEVPTFTNNGNDWNTSAFDIPVGGSISIQFTATISNTVIPGQMIQNTAAATFTSRDGSDANERDGSTANSEQGDDSDLNNYNTEANSPIITIDNPVALDKTFFPDPANTTYTIGETFSYRLTISLIEGTKNNLVVTDTLPDNLSFVSSTVGVGNMGITTGYMPPPGEAGQTLTFDLGDVLNPANGNVNDDFIIIDIQVQVEDVPANVDGSVLGNNASLEYTGPSGTETVVFDADAGTPGVQPLDFTIVEPNLAVTKTPSTATPSLGDEVTFTITVNHTGTSTANAFDVLLTDVIPAGLTYVVGSTLGQASVDESDASAPVFDLGTITLLEVQKTFTFRVRVEPSATVGAPITNTISAAYSSTDGANSEERQYMTDGSGEVTPTTTAAIIEADKAVAIAIDGANMGVADPGDTLTYTVILTNGNTTVTNAIFTDLLPVETTYVSGTLVSSVGGEDDSGAPTLAVDLGTMNPMDIVTITFDVTVNAGTPEGTVISNQGLVDSDQTVPEPTDSDGTDENGDQPTDITVGGPTPSGQPLYVEKLVTFLNDVDTSGDITAGDIMRYTLVFHNDGDADLTNVTLADIIPMGLTYVAASAVISSVGDSINVAGANVSVAIALLGVKQTITATFDVTIDPLPPGTMNYVNQGMANSDQTDPVLTDSNSDASDGNQPTVFDAVNGITGAPVLDFEKRWSLAVDTDGDGLVDPGDTLEYRLILQNTGSATATNVRINDAIPADTTIVAASVTTSLGAVVTEDPVNVNVGPLDPGSTALVLFRVTVDGGTANGTIIPNQALATSDNHPNTLSDDNGDDSDGINPTLTPVATDTVSGSPNGLSKSIFATSETSSMNSQVLIGEQVTYRISFNVPAGTIDEITMTDTLPVGLTYLPGSAELSRTFDTGLSSSTDPGGVNGAATGTFVGLADGSELEINGSQLSVYLGSVINSDNDANNETYTLQFVCQVDNIAGNQLGSMLTNQATLSYANQLGQIQNLTPVNAPVTVEEAVLQVNKAVTPALLLTAGGDVTFTITVTNPAGANVGTGYDVAITDMLPAQFTGLSVDSIVPAGGVSGITDNTAGTTLDVSINVFPPDGSLAITLTGTMPGPVAEGTVTNTVTVRWTSLPGTNGTGDVTTGNPGDSDGERTGSGGDNDLVTTDTADVLIGDAAVTKSIVNPQTRYAIGDRVEYQVVFDLPPGAVFNDVMFLDILDEGLTYSSGTFMYFLTPDVSESGNPLDFNVVQNSPNPGEESLMLAFDTVMNTGTVTRQLRVTYEAVVDNILGNQNNQMLSNNVNVSFTDPGGSGNTINLNDTSDLTIGEPNLALSKAIISPVVGLDAGDTISFEITVANNGTTTAFETVLSDILPTGLENITGLMALMATGGAETPTFTNNGTDWNTSAFDIPVGGTVTIQFTATISIGVIPGQTIQNTVMATFTSRDGSDANERDGSTANSEQGDDSDLNNYNTEANSPIVTIDNPVALDKTFFPDPANTTYTIGETFFYRLTISLIEGTKNDLVVTDILPDNLIYISSLVGVGNMGITTGYMPPPGIAGQTLTFDLGDVINPANGNVNDDFITIDIEVQIEDVPANVDGSILGNHASLEFTGPAGTQTIEFDADAGTPGAQPLDLTIVEPDLTVSKALSTITPSLGDEVTLTITVDHTVASNSDAFDVVLTNIIPTGLTYVLGSTMGQASVNETDPNAPVFDLGTITLAEDQKMFTFRVRVDESAPVGVPITNTISLVYSTIDGSNPEEREYTDSDNCEVTPSTTAAIIEADKTVAIAVDGANPGVADPGDTLTYTVVLTNGDTTVTNAVFTDILPVETTYVPGTLSSSVGGEDDSGAPSLGVNIGTMNPMDVVTITFNVTVNAGTPEGTVISNQGVIDSDQTVPEPTDSDGTDENGDQPTDITVGGPTPSGQPLYVEKLVSWFDDVDTSGDITSGDVMRYTLIFHNNGDEDLTNVTLSDVIPAGLSYVGASATISQAGDSITVVGSNVSVAIALLGVKQTITATFDVTIDVFPGTTMSYVNQGSADSDQTGTVLTDSNSDPSDGNQATVFTAVNGIAGAPALDFEKRWSLAVDADGDGFVDPGDTLEYRLMLQNTGSATATNVRINDAIPPDTTIVATSVRTSLGAVVTEDPVNINVGPLDPGRTALVIFRVTVDAGTPNGTIIPNQALTTSDNHPNTLSDDNGDDSDGINPTLTPVATDMLAGAPGELAKSLVTTSEPDSAGNQVYIGETVTFDITFSVPAGTTDEVTIVDTLPMGLSYLANSAQLSRTFETGLTSSTNPGGVNSAATGVLIGLTDGVDLAINGNEIRVYLGSVINSDNDANSETYQLRFACLVDNIATNQLGTTLVNQAGLSYADQLGQIQNLTPVTADINVSEAALQVTKTVVPRLLLTLGGDATFTFTITNPSAANVGTAYDISILDVLPAAYSSLSIVNIVPAGGVAGITDNSSGTTMDIQVAVFPPDGSLIITADVTAPGPISLGTTITNNVNIRWTSLPGDHGTGNATPGNPGDSDGERTGVGTGVNDLVTTDSADILIGEAALTKTILNPQTRYAIGDTVDYQVIIDIPAGAVLDDSMFLDVLAEGLSYRTGTLQAQFTADLISNMNPADFTVTQDDPNPGEESLVLNWGTLNHMAAATGQITLTYQALVENILPNQNNAMLANNASYSFTDPGGGGGTITVSDDTTLTLGEPHLALTKAAISSTVGLDAGDLVDFEVVVTNDGTTTAFETVLMDVLPSGFENVSGLAVFASSGGAEVPTLTNNGSDWVTSAFDLPVGASLTIRFTITISNSVIPGQGIQNSVTASFTSRDGSDGNERDGSTANSNQDDDSDLNNYNTMANAPVIIIGNPVALNKEFFPDPANTTYTIGEILTYRLTLTLIEGIKNDLVVTDTLPAGLVYLASQVGFGNMGLTTGYMPPPTVAGQMVTFDFGQVINPSDGDSNNDFITIDIDVQIANGPGNQNGDILGNHASLQFTGANGIQVVDFDADAGTPGIQPLDLTIVEPELMVAKATKSEFVNVGDEVTFTVTLSHTVGSTADAYDINFVDTLPPGLVYVLGSGSLTPVINGNQLLFSVASLLLADGSIDITYRVRVESTDLGVPLKNAVVATYQSLPGNDAGIRTGVDGPDGLNDYETNEACAIVMPQGPFLDATKADELLIDADMDNVASPGDTLRYTLVLTNSGNAPATGVSFNDFPDPNTTLVAGSVTASQGTIILGNNPDDVTIEIFVGDVPGNNAMVIITFDVVVNDPFPTGVGSVENQGFFASGENPHIQTDDPDTTEGDDPTETPIVQGPILSLTKVDSVVVNPDGIVGPGDTIEYTLEIRNDGNEASGNLVLDDTPDPNTSLIVGSVTTSQGTVVTGNTAGDTSISVDVGSLPAASTVTISFQVLINDPLPPAVNQVVNQASLSEDGTPIVDSDDPDVDGEEDPTGTSLGNTPELSATKTDTLTGDTNGNMAADPGETLTYTVVIANSGDGPANEVVFNDILEPNLSLLVGSVTTSQGSILTGNNGGDVAVAVNIGTIASGGSVTITFEVAIADPLPAGTTQVYNQGIVSSSNAPDTPTDDPDVPGDEDETETPIGMLPVLTASKSDVLHIDDGDMVAGPGDTLRYTVEIANIGTADATGVTFADIPGLHTALVVGSVTTTQGSVTAGNTAGDTTLGVDIGTIPVGGSVTITFDVIIDDPIPANVTFVRNQGTVNSNELPTVLSDDPDVVGDDDPTDTPLGFRPILSATKSDALVIDVNGSGTANPGDTLSYSIAITNSGNGAANGVTFTDIPDSNTSLVSGSIITTQGSVTSGNDGNPPVGVNIGTIMAGDTVSISFQVLIDDPLAAGVTVLANQGVVTSDDGTVLTDDPDTPDEDDETETQVGDDPILDASKVDTLAVDADGNGVPSAGDTLFYQITIRNNGNGTATNVVFTDTPDVNTTIVPGSVSTSLGSIVNGQAGVPPVQVDLGDMDLGAEAIISFQVLIADPLPNGVNQVVNQGQVSSEELPVVLTDDPSEPGEEDPNVTPLGSSPLVDAIKRDVLLIDADNNGIASTGDTLLYQITISNRGNGTAVNLVFTDTPDPLTSIVAGTVQSSQGTIASGNDGNPPVTVDIGDVPAGGSVTVTFQVLIGKIPAGVTAIVNQGVVSGDNTVDVDTDDPDSDDPDDETETPLGDGPILSANKSDVLVIDADMSMGASGGDTLQYTVVIENSGNGSATGVVFTDTPDVNTTLVASSIQTSAGTITGGQTGTPPVVVDIGTMAPSTSVTISFRVTINDPVPAGVTQVSNQGTVTSNEGDVDTDDPDTPEEDDETDTPLGSSPLVDAFKTDALVMDLNGDGAASPGDTLAYTITLINQGSVTATGVFFEDTPDPNTTMVAGSVQTSQGQVLTGNGGTPPILVAVGDIPPMQQATITFRVTINNPFPTTISSVANQGMIRGDNIPDHPTDDPDTGDMDDETATPVVQADLEVVKTGPAMPIVAGQSFDYTIDITNLGPDDATSVVLIDNLPPQVSFVSSTASQGTCTYDANTHVMTCELGDLPVGDSIQVTLTVFLDEEGTITNTVTVMGDQHDPDGDNNDSNAEVTGLPGIDLELAKTVDNMEPNLNEIIVYTLTLVNLGPDVATGIVVEDLLPAGITYLSDTPSLGSYDNNTGLWSIPSVGINETATLDLEVQVTGIGTIENIAEITAADQTDLDSTPDNGPGEDDFDSVVIEVNTLVDLRVTKTVEQVYVRPGDLVQYTITIENLGPDTANNVFVTEVLPMGLTAINAIASLGTFDPFTRIWTVGSLALGEGATLELETVVDDDIFGELTNVAVGEADEPDVNPSDNTDNATVTSLAPVPTLSPMGLALLFLGLMAAAIWLRKKRASPGEIT